MVLSKTVVDIETVLLIVNCFDYLPAVYKIEQKYTLLGAFDESL
ncbi:hypothetical protein [Rivularia sp. UHCC 0363]|nr:hypothetical protein [Rivularia sp. UHCC 0363]MEA5598314.1 hypothetical protein [Rivularia sp. UHCC 0363]